MNRIGTSQNGAGNGHRGDVGQKGRQVLEPIYVQGLPPALPLYVRNQGVKKSLAIFFVSHTRSTDFETSLVRRCVLLFPSVVIELFEHTRQLEF
jgi:hypothetical protein